MGTNSAKRQRQKENEKKRQTTIARVQATSNTKPQTDQINDSKQKSQEAVIEAGESDKRSDARKPWPWIYLVAAACIFFSSISLTEHSFILSWTQDSPVNWNAQTAIFFLGIIALIPFIHALAAAQALGTAPRYATKEDRKLSRLICERALSWVAIGILAGILYGLFSLNGIQHNFKVTSVISDVSIVGGIAGLAICMPYNIKVTFVTMRRLRKHLTDRWIKTTIAFGIMDIFLLSKLAGLLQFISHLVH